MFDDDILHGNISWTKEGFQEVNTFLAELLKKPKDDWSLTPSRHNLFLSPFDPMGQVAKFLQSKYPHEYLWQAHLVRYNNIIRFFQENQEALVKNKLLVLKKPAPYIKDKLLVCLCKISYGEKREVQNTTEFIFSFEEVIRSL